MSQKQKVHLAQVVTQIGVIALGCGLKSDVVSVSMSVCCIVDSLNVGVNSCFDFL